MVFEIIPRADCRPDYGSDRTVEVGNRDFSMEDADSDILPGVLSFGTDTVCGARGFERFHILTSAVLCRGCARAIHDSFYNDWSRVEGPWKMKSRRFF
jgi:hypothetical protein